MTLTALLLVIAPGCTADAESNDKDSGGGDTDTNDTNDTNDTDTGDTDTGDTNDTGDTSDSGDTGGPDSGDTGNSPPPGAYSGPPFGFAIVGDRASGNSDEVDVILFSPMDSTVSTVADLTVRADSLGGCAGSMLWLLESNNSASTSDFAYGIDGSTGTLNVTLDLGPLFGPTAIMGRGDGVLIGGSDSATVALYGMDGAIASSVDLSSYADSDGQPEVVAFSDTPAGVAAVLARTSSTGYNQSGVVVFDPIGGTVAGNGLLSGTNAGRHAAFTMDGLTVLLQPTVTGSTTNEDGGVELFDTTTFASGGTVLDFTGVKRLATTLSSFDATVSAAIEDEDGGITIYRYGKGGALLAEVPSSTNENGLATLNDSFLSAEGKGAAAKIVAYMQDGTTLGSATIGEDIRGIWSCAPAPTPPDTGDTGPRDSGPPPE